jgi:glutathione S-transferase
MAKPTLIYFPARGRAELIRLVLAEAGVDYEEHPVGRGTPPLNGRPTDFAALKASGDLPFEAVPVWEEPDGFRLAQSLAIVNHVGRAHGLGGRTPVEAAQIDQWLGAYEDVRAELRKLTPMPADQRPAFRAELKTKILPRWLGYLDRLLRANRGGTDYAFFIQKKHDACLLRLYGEQKGFVRYTNTLWYIATRELPGCDCSE